MTKLGVMKFAELLRNLKGGKSLGTDEIAVEHLKKGEICVLEWLVRIFNGCMREERVHVLFFCLMVKGIRLLSVVGIVYRGILVECISSSID